MVTSDGSNLKNQKSFLEKKTQLSDAPAHPPAQHISLLNLAEGGALLYPAYQKGWIYNKSENWGQNVLLTTGEGS